MTGNSVLGSAHARAQGSGTGGRRWRRLTAVAVQLALALAAAPGAARAREAAGLDDLDRAQPRIVNGSLTFDYETTGALLEGGNPSTASVVCSGVLIGCRTFLTAAHCVCPGIGADCQPPNAPDPSNLLVFTQHAGFLAVNAVIVHPSFDFPIADFAVLKLGPVADAIRPSVINDTAPAIPMAATIAGFGRSGGGSFNDDFGIKRVGSVTTTSCTVGSDTDLVCWNFVGPGSNTCGGDSGGPMFMDFGTGDVVAGVTSGGANPTCLPNDHSYDGNVATYAAWIEMQGGADLANTSCGSGTQIGDADATVLAFNGSLDAVTTTASHDFLLPAGTDELRIAMNAHDDGTANFNLYVKQGSPPSPGDFDCAQTGLGQFGYCRFVGPPGGEWYVRVDRLSGDGQYQITSTNLGTQPSVCGNSVREPGEGCDGGDASQCPGLCEPSCDCPPPTCGNGVTEAGEDCDGGDDAACPLECSGVCSCPCIVGFLDVSRLIVNDRKLLLKADIDNTSGAYDMLDPRDDFAFLLDDGVGQINVVIPTLDPGWDRSKPEKGRYKWKGLIDGVKRILIKDQSEKKGLIRIKILGKEVPGGDVLTTTAVTAEISLDGECVGQDLLDP